MASKRLVLRRNILTIGIASVISLGFSGAASANSDKLDLDIKAQNIGPALVKLGEYADVQIMTAQTIGDSIQLPPIKGSFTLNEALQKMLANSGLTYEFTSEDLVIIKEKTEKTNPETLDDQEENDVDEEIVVTGSRIARTPSQMAANVLVLDGDELRASGESTLEGALRRLPQNMFGASPVGATLPNAASMNGALNITGASTINLRGLGSESTLILVDGRRIGKSGVFGGVTDITGIPFSAIERVEILLDGASSVYGSDAVGGVVNVIMKKDYQGLEAKHVYGTPEQGGFEEHVFSVNGGFAWDSGAFRATFEHFQRSNLDGDERPEIITRDQVYHSPGFVHAFALLTYEGQSYFPLDLSEVLGLPSEPWYLAGTQPGVGFGFFETKLPDGQDGSNLSFDDFNFRPDTRGLYDEFTVNRDASGGVSLLPAQQRDTLNVSFEQILNLWGREMTLSGSAYYSNQSTYAANGGFRFSASVSPYHPLNVFGQPVQISWYAPVLAERHYYTDRLVSRWNLALDGTIAESWKWAVSVGRSRSKADSNYFNEQADDEVINQLVDNGLNVFASDIVAVNSPELLAQLVKPESPSLHFNEENTLDVEASGKLFSLPGGDVRLAVGVDWQQTLLDTESSRRISRPAGQLYTIGEIPGASLPDGPFSKRNSETQRSGYAELLLPIVGTDNAITGIEQLILTGSSRYNSYHGKGSDSTWSLGAIWSPIDQIKLKINQSTSFAAPSFSSELIDAIEIDFISPGRPNGLEVLLFDTEDQFFGVDYISTQITGGNPDLKPVSGTSRSISLAVTPDALPGFMIKATWHGTEYKDRIGSPQRLLVGGVDYVSLYPNISRDEQGSLIMDLRSVNIGSEDTAGIDYLLSYTRGTDFGQFSASVNVAYTTKHNREQVPGDQPINQLAHINIASDTVIPATRYHAFLGWAHRGLSVNLVADTASKTVSTGDRFDQVWQQIESPALDASLTMTYDFERGDLFAVPNWLQSTEVGLRVLNVLDDRPTTKIINLETGESPLLSTEFNPNTARPRGRMFYLSLTKRF